MIYKISASERYPIRGLLAHPGFDIVSSVRHKKRRIKEVPPEVEWGQGARSLNELRALVAFGEEPC